MPADLSKIIGYPGRSAFIQMMIQRLPFKLARLFITANPRRRIIDNHNVNSLIAQRGLEALIFTLFTLNFRRCARHMEQNAF